MRDANSRVSDRVGAEESPPWAALTSLLEQTLGDETRARAMLSSALATSTRDSFPTSAGDVLELAANHVLPHLASVLGVPIARAFLETLERDLAARLPEAEAGRISDVRRARPRQPSISGAPERPLVLLITED